MCPKIAQNWYYIEDQSPQEILWNKSTINKIPVWLFKKFDKPIPNFLWQVLPDGGGGGD